MYIINKNFDLLIIVRKGYHYKISLNEKSNNKLCRFVELDAGLLTTHSKYWK